MSIDMTKTGPDGSKDPFAPGARPDESERPEGDAPSEAKKKKQRTQDNWFARMMQVVSDPEKYDMAYWLAMILGSLRRRKEDEEDGAGKNGNGRKKKKSEEEKKKKEEERKAKEEKKAREAREGKEGGKAKASETRGLEEKDPYGRRSSRGGHAKDRAALRKMAAERRAGAAAAREVGVAAAEAEKGLVKLEKGGAAMAKASVAAEKLAKPASRLFKAALRIGGRLAAVGAVLAWPVGVAIAAVAVTAIAAHAVIVGGLTYAATNGSLKAALIAGGETVGHDVLMAVPGAEAVVLGGQAVREYAATGVLNKKLLKEAGGKAFHDALYIQPFALVTAGVAMYDVYDAGKAVYDVAADPMARQAIGAVADVTGTAALEKAKETLGISGGSGKSSAMQARAGAKAAEVPGGLAPVDLVALNDLSLDAGGSDSSGSRGGSGRSGGVKSRPGAQAAAGNDNEAEIASYGRSKGGSGDRKVSFNTIKKDQADATMTAAEKADLSARAQAAVHEAVNDAKNAPAQQRKPTANGVPGANFSLMGGPHFQS